MVPVCSQNLFESAISGGNNLSGNEHVAIGGFVRTAAYLARTPGDEIPYMQSTYAQVGLLMHASMGKWSTAKADIRFRYGNEWEENLSEMEIREAWVDLSAGIAGLRAGKLIAPWGKATLFNPVEKITPVDPILRSPDRDEMNMGVWALQGRLHLGDFMKLTGTWKPLYRASTLLIDPVPLPGYVSFLEPDFPGMELSNGSYGVRWDLYAPALDASLYWFDGYSHWPGIAFDTLSLDPGSMEPESLQLFEKAYRIRMAGMDLAVPVGAWIIRAEGAWQQSVDSYEDHACIPFPEIAYCGEIERSGTFLTFIGGYYGKYILDYTPPLAEPALDAGLEQFNQLMTGGFSLNGELINTMIEKKIGAFNRLYNYQLEECYHTAFMVLKGNFWHERLEPALSLIGHVTTQEWMIQPQISYRPLDGLSIIAGFSGLFGKKGTLYDLAGPVLNAGYLSLKIQF